MYEGAEKIDKEKLLELSGDIRSPCARYYSSNVKNVSKIKAKLIRPGANIPITEKTEVHLYKGDMLCVLAKD